MHLVGHDTTIPFVFTPFPAPIALSVTWERNFHFVALLITAFQIKRFQI